MLTIHLKKITLTMLGFINASIQWRDYHRGLEFWSLIFREKITVLIIVTSKVCVQRNVSLGVRIKPERYCSCWWFVLGWM